MTGQTLLRARGFTLIELAVALAVLAIMTGSLLGSLRVYVEQRDVQQTEQQLARVIDALYGYALVNGHLPCPASEADPGSPAYGVEDARDGAGNCPTLAGDGVVPWKTLGMTEALDAWGAPRVDGASAWTGYLRYRVAPEFANSAAPIRLDTQQNATVFLRVRNETDTADLTDIRGRPPQAPVAVIYSTGPDRTPNGRNGVHDLVYQGGTRSEAFDDITVWVARPALLAKLVTAGRVE